MSRLENFIQCNRKSDKKTFDNPFRTVKREIYENHIYDEEAIECIIMSRVFNDFSRDINMAHEAFKLNIDNKNDRQSFYNQIASMIDNTLKRHSEYKEHPLYEVLEKRLEKINALQEGYKIIDERKLSHEIS